MKLGISTYTFGWAVGVKDYEPATPMTELDLIQVASNERIGLLQIGDNLPLHSFDSARLQALAAVARSKGIQLEVGARRLVPERVEEYMRIARTLNARLIRFVIDDSGYHPDPASITAILREVAPLLDGVLLGIENHDRFPALVLRRIIEAAGSKQVGVCLDTANSLGAGEGIERVLEILAPLTVNLHIKDFWIERIPSMMGFSVTGRPAGDGMLEIQDLLDSVARFKKCETAILELWTAPESSVENTIAKEARWAAQSLEYLKPFFPTYL